MKSIAMAALLMSAAPAPEVGAPLAPVGKWTVDYAQTTCVLSHDFGDAVSPVSLSIAPLPLGGQSDIVVFFSAGAKIVRGAKGIITIDPGSKSVRADIAPLKISGEKRHGIRLRVSGDAATLLADAGRMTIAQPASATSFALPDIHSALAALRACQDDLLKAWKIDPQERDFRADRQAVDLTVVAQRIGRGEQVKDPPAPVAGNDPAGWITSDDYPVEALTGESQGSVLMLWTIGADGRVPDCRLLVSSGVAALDHASCNAIAKRARYAPLKDKDGNPVVTHATGRITWQIPR